ncbi:MAG: polysaccharide biosynthesis/export family protein [bacterium]
MPTAESEHVFQPGDVAEVKFRFCPELNEVQTVRADGMISLQVVNEVEAAGLRPAELRSHLIELYGDELVDPEITVIARLEQNRWVYVGGEVNKFRNVDGLLQVPCIGNLTAAEAIMSAGGFLKGSAKLSNVLIIRRMGDTQYMRMIDMRLKFRGSETAPVPSPTVTRTFGDGDITVTQPR